MNRTIYLFWFTKKNHFNFGDDINPFIVENLSGNKVKRVMVFDKKKPIIINFLKMVHGFLSGIYGVSVFSQYLRSHFHSNYMVGIGSILQNDISENAKIWGAGIISKDSFINKSEFCAVRGLKTVERIQELGYQFDGKIGDPALLLPLIYNPDSRKYNRIGVIPHVTHFETAKELFKDQDRYILIDLSENNIKKTIELIKSCSYIVSSSLHGLIVSHAYNTPALHIQLGKKLAGDGIKFLDYYSSIGIKAYNAVEVSNSELLNQEFLEDLFAKYSKHALPVEGIIGKLQKDLLSVTPFELSGKYKSYLSNQCN